MADIVKKESIFLTIDEAVRAICIDFRQYPPQTMLFAGLIALISNNTIFLQREPEKNGAWINQKGQRNMHWLDGPQLIDDMCEAISNTQWHPDRLAQVCSRVFQTKAFSDNHPKTGEAGVRVETNMETFSCRQCGQCCRSLKYHNELKDEDVSNWKKLGREDILKWVACEKREDAPATYRIWVSPKTRRIVETCPFLVKNHTSNLWQCQIQDVKPAICRQYPTSRKHGLMTGCMGFQPPTK